jgi:hypothetical protein
MCCIAPIRQEGPSTAAICEIRSLRADLISRDPVADSSVPKRVSAQGQPLPEAPHAWPCFPCLVMII